MTIRPRLSLVFVIDRADSLAKFPDLQHDFDMIVVASVCFECLEVIVGRDFHDVPRASRVQNVLADFERADHIDLVRQRTELIDNRSSLACAGFRSEFEEHDVFDHGSVLITDWPRFEQDGTAEEVA